MSPAGGRAVPFTVGIGSDDVGEDGHQNQYHYGNAAGRAERLLLDQPGQELRAPAALTHYR